jgi:hypothetical protein
MLMATESDERIMKVFFGISLVLGIGVAVYGEMILFAGLPSGRYPIILFALPLVAGAAVAFVVAMLAAFGVAMFSRGES